MKILEWSLYGKKFTILCHSQNKKTLTCISYLSLINCILKTRYTTLPKSLFFRNSAYTR